MRSRDSRQRVDIYQEVSGYRMGLFAWNFVNRFERDLADYVGVRNAVAHLNGTPAKNASKRKKCGADLAGKIRRKLWVEIKNGGLKMAGFSGR